MAAERIPVLIVGGGPIGLALAIDLGMRGIKTVLIERRDGTIRVPRIGQENTRTMEFCRRWGIANTIREAGYPPDHPGDVVYITSMVGYELARLKFPSAAARGELRHTPEGKCRCSQLFFDPILRDRADSFPDVTLRYHTALQNFGQDEDCVRAEVSHRETGETETLEASYLIGCDGAESTVRELSGIGQSGDPAIGLNLTGFFRSEDLISVHDKGRAVHNRLVGPSGLWGNLNAVNGRDLFRLELTSIDPETKIDAVDMEAFIRKAVGTDFEFELLANMPWTRHELVADKFRDGRVFLAGDAAHSNSPTGGHGMNTGIGDAADLSWKLAAMVEGWGGAHLLESYEIERRPVCLRNVREATNNFTRLRKMLQYAAIAEDTPEGERQREAFAAAHADTGDNQQYDNEGIGLGYRYDPSPICWPDGSPEPPDDAIEYVQTARPGHRAPHAWVAPGTSTLDLFGDGFTLFRFGDDTADTSALTNAATDRGVPLRLHDIDDAGMAELYERKLVLVRPDGHVAWRGDSIGSDADGIIDRLRGA